MGERRYAWGAEPLGEGVWDFRLWAPDCPALDLWLDGRTLAMEPRAEGWFVLETPARAGMPYRFVLPGGRAVPDPASRRQSGDVHGPSVVTAPRRTEFGRGRPWEEAVIYELHVGTFTPEGTFRAAIADLSRLAGLGITAVELLPVAHFAGDRGWGYDGVLPYAPHPAYGTPDDLAAFVEACHAEGLMAFLDVVYNHFGPEGNHLHGYAEPFFDAARTTPWGPGIDYTKGPVRRFFIENAFYWLDEFGFDGLRLDAVDQIVDPSSPELLVELAEELRRRLPDRPVHLTTEDNRNVVHLHERDPAGAPVRHTAEWNDDMHNAAHVFLTGESDGYYAPFVDDPLAHLGRALAEGYAFQGEGGRGEPSAHLPPAAFVDFLQNHDQTGNRAFGDRLATLADPQSVEVMTAILLLSPHIPLMFMGEEYGETRPFLFFAGFEGALAEAVSRGRRAEFAEFSAFADGTGEVPDPIAPGTFERSKLDRDRLASEPGQEHMGRVARLLELRARHVVPHLRGASRHAGTCLVASDGALAVDWRLDGALLQLRACFAQASPPLPPARGEEIHRVGAPFCGASHWIEPAA